MNKTIYLLLICTIFIFIQKTNAEDLTKLALSLQSQLDEVKIKYDLPGITFSLVFNNKEAISLASGYSNIEKGTMMQSDQRMFSGSVGKTFVAAIALELIENGAIKLENPISEYLGTASWFSQLPNHNEITVRDLLQHTSGLPRYILQAEFIADLKENPLRDRLPEENIGYILNSKPIHPAGKGWAYSDTNYLLLGLILEKVSGRTYWSLLSGLLDKHGLKNTEPSIGLHFDKLAQGYVANNLFGLPDHMLEDENLSINPEFEWTGGGVVTNVTDLAKWMKYLHEGEVISEQMYKEMISPVHMGSGKPYATGYGLGSFIWARNNDEQYGHSGFFPGYVTQVEYSRNKHYAIAVQINSDGAGNLLPMIVYELSQIVDQHLESIDREKIIENFKKQEICWNNHDIACYMTAYHPSKVFQTISRSGVTEGFEKIKNSYEKNFPKNQMGKLFFDEMTISKWSDKHYFVTGRFNLEMDNQSSLIQGWFSATFERYKGEWFIVTDHSS